MTALQWVTAITLWAISVATMIVVDIKCTKRDWGEPKRDFTFGRLLFDVFLGTIGCGVYLILLIVFRLICVGLFKVVAYMCYLLDEHLLNKKLF